MIYSIVFDDTIPITLNERESTFRTDAGWDIREVAPGRVELRNREHLADFVVVSQGLPYTLCTADPAPEVVYPDDPPPPIRSAPEECIANTTQQAGHKKRR